MIAYLGNANTGMFGAYRGVTGNLTLDDQGLVSRSLRCAEFSNGVPVLLEQGSSDEIQ
jgi:outer membrane PBP1 activator LpoA protein